MEGQCRSILPFFELSKALALKGIRVSLISTPRNLQRLPPIPQELAPQINLVGFPLPLVEGLPKNANATIENISLEKVQYLKKAYDGLRAPFEELVAKVSPDWILVDFAPYWAPAIAFKYGIPCCFFIVFSAACCAFGGAPESLNGVNERKKVEDFTVVPGWIPFPTTIAFRPHEVHKIFQDASFDIPNASGVSDGYRFGSTVEGCRVVAVRTCNEFEEGYLDLLEKLYEKSVIPIGFLPLARKEREGSGNSWNDENKWDIAFHWLDAQPLREPLRSKMAQESYRKGSSLELRGEGSCASVGLLNSRS
ncbi:hypothetical protein AMTRI_Chr13g123950 [Amborella trichopoda]